MLVDHDASLLLHYAQHPAIPAKARFSIPSSLILDVKDPRALSLEVWGGDGYRDLGIDVCEADVPALFTENFDWQDMRRHLVCGVLQSDLLGKHIGVYKVGQEAQGALAMAPAIEGDDVAQSAAVPAERTYVERVRDTRTFGDISRDILRRWAYPLVPDYLGVLGGDDYELRRGGMYIAKEAVVLARTTALFGPLLLGPQTALAQNTSVRRSVLGRNNRIAASSSITDAYLFDNVVVGRGCVLEGCIIGEGVVLEDGVRIGKGALVGGGVKIGARQTIGEFARIGRTARAPGGFEDEEDEEDEGDEDEGGHQPGFASVERVADSPPYCRRGKATGRDLCRLHMAQRGGRRRVGRRAGRPIRASREPPAVSLRLVLGVLGSFPASDRAPTCTGRDMDDVSYASSSISTLSHASTSAPSTPLSEASSTSDTNIPNMSLGVPSSSDFPAEGRLSLDRAVEEEHKVEDALLELKTLMLSSNVGVSGPGGAREVVVTWLMDLIHVGAGDARAAKTQADDVWERWGGILTGMGAGGSETMIEVQVSEHALLR